MDKEIVEYYTESVIHSQDVNSILPSVQYTLAPPPLPAEHVLPPLPPPPPPPPSSPYPTSPQTAAMKMSPQPATPKKPPQPVPLKKAPHVCRDFIRGTCERPSCKFVHAIDDKTLDEVTKFCHDFQNKGCKRENCKYLHCTIKEQTEYYNTGKLPAAALEMIRKQEDKSSTGCKNGDACAFLGGDVPGEMPPMSVPPPPIASCPPPPKVPQPPSVSAFNYPPPIENSMQSSLLSAVQYCTVPPPPPADMPPRNTSNNVNLLMSFDQKLQKIPQLGVDKCPNCADLEIMLQEKEKICDQVIYGFDECCKENEKYMQNILNSFIILNEQAPMSVNNVLNNIVPEIKKLGSSSEGFIQNLQNTLLSFNTKNMTQNSQPQSDVLQQIADKISLNNLLNSLQTQNFPQTNVYNDYALNLINSLTKPVQQRTFQNIDPYFNVSQLMNTSQPINNLQYTKTDQPQMMLNDSNKSLNTDFSTHNLSLNNSQLLAQQLRAQNFPPVKDNQMLNTGPDMQSLPFGVHQNENFMSLNEQLLQSSKQTLSNNNTNQSLMWQQQMMASAQPNSAQQYVTANSIGSGQQYVNVTASNPLNMPNTQQTINSSANQVNPNSYQRIVTENVSSNSQLMTGPQYVPFNTMPTSHQLVSSTQAQLINQMTNPHNSSSQMVQQPNQNQQTSVGYTQNTLQR